MFVFDILEEIRRQVVEFSNDENTIVRLEATSENPEGQLNFVVIVGGHYLPWYTERVDFMGDTIGEALGRDSLVDQVMARVKTMLTTGVDVY